MSVSLRLLRIAEREDATLGVLFVDEIPRLVTLELPWRFNEKEISCIPLGRYLFERFVSPKHGETFKLLHVPDREEIEFHPGNTAHDTKGCILVGNRFGVVTGKSMIIESKDAFEWLLRFIGDRDDGELTVQAAFKYPGASAL